MDLFALKLVLSFFVGGAFIATLSVLAEKYKKLSGAIIGLPSISAVSLLFIGWTQSIDAAVEATTVMPVSLGVVLLFVLAYVYVARRTKGRKSIIAAATASLAFWLALSLLVVKSNLGFQYSVLGFLVAFLPAAYFLGRRKKTKAQGDRTGVPTSKGQLLARSAFSGSVVALAVFLSNALGPAWGGVFAVFPASYFSSLVLLHYYRGRSFLSFVENTVHLGVLVLFVYAVLARYLYPAVGLVPGTIIAYAAVFLVMLYFWKSR
jgi:hypothetical protein